jgi:hypothetical protein
MTSSPLMTWLKCIQIASNKSSKVQSATVLLSSPNNKTLLMSVTWVFYALNIEEKANHAKFQVIFNAPSLPTALQYMKRQLTKF